VSSAAANSALVGQIFNAVDRQNVGITLDIVPQVTEGDYIRMDVYEEVSSVVGGTQNSTLGPTTTIRAASTTVMVQDHRTTVIGGLLSDTTSLQAQGIPFFSSVPVLGNLFSNTSRTGDKTNLLVFLTPHVIRTRQDLRSLSLDEREKFLKSLGKKELHDMPMSQVRELYKPSFSIAVPPSAELGNEPSEQAPAAAGPAPSGEIAPPPPPTPLNTEEINPSSKSDESSSGVASGLPANASVRAADASPGAPAPVTAPSAEGKSSSGSSASAVAATESASPASLPDPPGVIKKEER
jgi:general secretion pathway protein D